MPDIADVLRDLADEGNALDELVAGLADDAWRTPTPSEGWTIAHQIGHLTWTDEAALAAATDPAAFVALVSAGAAAPTRFVDDAAEQRTGAPADALLQAWRGTRAALAAALADVPAGAKLPWFGPPMGATSMATARLMEIWAHGQDVADALGVARMPTDRLRHVAHIGVRTRDFAYALNDRTPPSEPFRVELTGPSGEVWAWGPDDTDERVTGPALDFCLLVTQRRHRGDLDLMAAGAQAEEWLDVAQAFAGPPGGGRTAGQFA